MEPSSGISDIYKDWLYCDDASNLDTKRLMTEIPRLSSGLKEQDEQEEDTVKPPWKY